MRNYKLNLLLGAILSIGFMLASTNTSYADTHELENNNSMANADTIKVNDTCYGKIGKRDDIDYFKYVATTNGVNEIEMHVSKGYNNILTIMDFTGKQIHSAMNSGIRLGINFETQIGQTYFISIEGDYLPDDEYTIDITNKMSFEYNDSISRAYRAKLDHYYLDTITVGDEDVYKIDSCYGSDVLFLIRDIPQGAEYNMRILASSNGSFELVEEVTATSKGKVVIDTKAGYQYYVSIRAISNVSNPSPYTFGVFFDR